MKIFNKDTGSWSDKVNFVDDNNVLVGFDMSGQCCENFGWFLSNEAPTKILEDASEVEMCDIDPEGYQFDTNYFEQPDATGDCFDESSMAVFRLTKGESEIFLTLHNTHNGYYSHGFTMEIGGVEVKEGSL